MIRELREKIEKKEISADELISSYLEKEDRLDSFIYRAEKAVNESDGPLSGIPVAIKDNILVEGLPCTAASKILSNYTASYDATVIKKLKQAGAVIVGKTNLDEFAMGSSTEYSAFKVTRNPYDSERVAGGSSGGSAAAVADDLAVFALGSDTGGSIRQPASFCGVVGMRPTYGSVSRSGLIALASSMDQIGPLTKTAEDALLIYRIIRGRDVLDATSYDIDNVSGGERIGVAKEYFSSALDPRIKDLISSKIKGAVEVSLPHTDYALPCYCMLTAAEASTNMARYDGLRYGQQVMGENLDDTYIQTRTKMLGMEVQRRIVFGVESLTQKQNYIQASRVRSLIKQDFDRAFQKVDFIVTPTSPFLPFKINERDQDPVAMYLADLLTVTAGLAGLPAVSIPCGFIDGLPVGLQVMGRPGSDESILEFCAKLEKQWK